MTRKQYIQICKEENRQFLEFRPVLISYKYSQEIKLTELELRFLKVCKRARSRLALECGVCNEKDALTKVIRSANNNRSAKIGVVIAYKENGKIYIGGSKCKTSVEKFNKAIGLNKAIKNATEYSSLAYVPAATMKKDFEKMYQRAIRYFFNEKQNQNQNSCKREKCT